MHKQVQDLQFGDLVRFEGKTIRITDIVPLNMGLYAVGLSPTNRMKPDFKALVPRTFKFKLVSS